MNSTICNQKIRARHLLFMSRITSPAVCVVALIASAAVGCGSNGSTGASSGGTGGGRSTADAGGTNTAGSDSGGTGGGHSTADAGGTNTANSDSGGTGGGHSTADAGGTNTLGGGGSSTSLDGSRCSLGDHNDCDLNCISNCPECASCCTVNTTYGLLCGSKCIDPNKDSANCGACGNGCSAAQLCEGGKCLNDCSAPSAASLVAACTTICAKLSATCGYSVFPWPSNSIGGGNVSYRGADQCKIDCLAHGNGPCSDAMTALANCWASGLTCDACHPGMCASGTTGFADFPACANETSAASQCLGDCAP